jgi:hypothetical protein
MSFVNLQHIHSKADFIGALLPQAQDAVHPHTFFPNALVELYVADVVKHVGASLSDKTLSKHVLELSKKMAGVAASAAAAAWEPGDEICPPYPFPFPHLDIGGPQPEPWVEVNAAVQIELAHVLIRLAGQTSNAELNRELKGVATQIAHGSAGALADDFEKCGTKPRQPLPGPRR